MHDWLVVGAGFAGSVIAERIASERGEKVLVIDRRDHIAGNAYDHPDEAGVMIHRYGPHIFHTNSAAIVEYLSRFTEWRPYEHRVLAMVDGMLLPIPINLDTVNRLYGMNLDSEGMEVWLETVREPVEKITVRSSGARNPDSRSLRAAATAAPDSGEAKSPSRRASVRIPSSSSSSVTVSAVPPLSRTASRIR